MKNQQPLETNGRVRYVAQSSRDRVIGYIGFVILLLAAVLLIWAFAVSLFKSPVAVFRQTDNLSVSSMVIHPGQAEVVTIPYCKNQNIDSNITVGLQDSNLIGSFATVTRLPLGCHTAKLTFPVSQFTQPDHYHFLIEVMYNPPGFGSRPEVHELTSQEFEVVR